MFLQIKNKIDKELLKFTRSIDKLYSLNKISPLLYSSIKDYILRDGKRVRPALFIIGYLGFASKVAKGLYTSALSMELLHDFMLVHDDIIDKSDKRRNKPSMHKMLNNYLAGYKKIKFNGEDLAIAIGDVLFAIAVKAFLAIKEEAGRKEKALKKFIEAAIYTGCGEFIELLNGIKNLEEVTKDDIYKIYIYKTACYTFSTPLSAGAILAGANDDDINKLFQFGINIGKAFQIKDDILSMFGQEDRIGKPNLTDIQEGKRTLLIWYAYNNSDKNNQLLIKKILMKGKVTLHDLLKMREIIKKSGALKKAENEISCLVQKAQTILTSCSMNSKYKNSLYSYVKHLLS